MIKDFKSHFPFLRDLTFIQFWPGLIDTSRDLLPIVVRPPKQPHVQFIMGVVGLPWAAFAGGFAARCALGTAEDEYKKYYPYFTNRRHFFLSRMRKAMRSTRLMATSPPTMPSTSASTSIR